MRNSILVLILIGAFSCNTPKETPIQLNSGIFPEHMDQTVKPGDDFMNYVNGTWIKNTEIPADKASYGIGYMVHEESEENVKKIIEESSQGEFAEGSDEQKVGDLYTSFMNWEKRNELGINPLTPEFEKIDQINSYDELAVYFAYASKYGYSAPISTYINQDFKNPTEYAFYTLQSGLGLPDREYYLKDDERSQEILDAYKAHISKMLELCGIENPNESTNKIFNLETKIAEKHLEKEKVRDLVSLYNMIEVSGLPDIMPDFNWTGFLNEAGASDLDKVGVLMIDYTRSLNEIINSTDLDTWRVYLKWGVIDANAPYLTEEIDQQNFSFFRKELYDIQEQRPMWRRGVSVVNQRIGEIVGKVYVQRHFPPEAKERMDELVKNLQKAYKKSIENLDWMTDSTKQSALYKLSTFNPKIGYPKKWTNYDALSIDKDDLFGNIRNASLFAFNKEINKLGKPIDRDEWFMTPQTVNAYYNPPMNEIVFPAAILQTPFFNLEADDAVNYGAIGAIIGHEIGHGFDDKGSTFDGDGALKNWWTDTDRAEFEKRTQRLVEQFNGYEALPGVFVNGEFTQGENIGDLGGLSIALKAY